MVFQSPLFLFSLAGLVFFYALAPGFLRIYLITAFSLFWYGSFRWDWLIPLSGVCVLTFFCLRQLQRSRSQVERRSILILFFLVFGFAFYFLRYRVDARDTPMGLSFFLFQSAGLFLDSYSKPTVAPSLTRVTAFVSFFPQLMAGPVERFRRLQPQLDNLGPLRLENFRQGAILFSWGFFKKVAVADLIALPLERISGANSIGAPAFWLAGLLMTFRVYADFSGYTDMGRGIAKLFGIDLSISFRPFIFAKSPTDFWRRWHITLATWFRDYVVLAIAKTKSHSALRTNLAILISFFLMGAWHGLQFNWLVFGAFHGLAVVVERNTKNLGWPMPAFLRHFLMLGFFIISGLLHFSENASDYSQFFHRLWIDWDRWAPALDILGFLAPVFITFLLMEVWIEKKGSAWHEILALGWWFAPFWIVVALFMKRATLSSFIYFTI